MNKLGVVAGIKVFAEWTTLTLRYAAMRRPLQSWKDWEVVYVIRYLRTLEQATINVGNVIDGKQQYVYRPVAAFIKKISSKIPLDNPAETCVEVEDAVIVAIVENFWKFQMMDERQRSEFCKSVAYKIIRPSVEYSNNERKVEGDVYLKRSTAPLPADVRAQEEAVRLAGPEEDSADVSHGRPRRPDLKLVTAAEERLVATIDMKRRGWIAPEESPVNACFGSRHFELPESVPTEYERVSEALTGERIYPGEPNTADLADINDLEFFWKYLCDQRGTSKFKLNWEAAERQRFARLAEVCGVHS